MATKKEREEFRVFEVDGVKYKVRQPTFKELADARRKYREVFNEELAAGTLLRDQLDDELRKRKLWNDDREAKYQGLRQEIIDGEYRLSKGGIKLSEARALALEMQDKRNEMVDMLSAHSQLSVNTCEGKADSTRFNYLFVNCLVYSDTDAPYFKNGIEEYLSRLDDPVAEKAAVEFFNLISNTEQDDGKLPENKFLKKFNFIDDKSRLIDKDGRLIDRSGKHVDEDGRYIKWISDTEYVKVDVNGRELDDEGNFIVEPMPFLDDDGNPIEETEDKPKKRTSTSKKAAAATEPS